MIKTTEKSKNINNLSEEEKEKRLKKARDSY